MVTRKVHNVGAPLRNLNGQIASNKKISFVLIDAVTKKPCDVFDTETKERIGGRNDVTTDINGEFEINLFPNTRGDKNTLYLVHVHDKEFDDFTSALQDGTEPLTWFEFKHGGTSIPPSDYDLVQEYIQKIQSKLDELDDLTVDLTVVDGGIF